MPSAAFVARSGRLALVAVTLLGAAAGGAQEGRFSGSVEVHTVTVEVEVTRRGRPVTGLTREDFRILEDGEEREITHFAWVGGGTTLQGPGGEERVTAPPGAQAPHVLLLFDLNGLRGPRLARAVEAAREWLDAGRDREVLWSVAAVGTRPRILLPFTRDAAAARSALESVTSLPRPAPASSAGADLALDPASYQPTLSRGAGPGEAAGTPRSTLERFTDLLAWQEARDRVERFALLARGLAGILKGSAAVQGPKTVVLFSGEIGLPLDPAGNSATVAGSLERQRGRLAQAAELDRRLQEIALEMGRLAATMGFRIFTVTGSGPGTASPEGFEASAGGRSDLLDETAGPTSLGRTGPTVDLDAVPRILA